MSFCLNSCYWGYSFEKLATEDSRLVDGDHHIDANVEFCSVLKTKLGAHRIVMGAEMDCFDTSPSGNKYYVELKTTREVNFKAQLIFLHIFHSYLITADCNNMISFTSVG